MSETTLESPLPTRAPLSPQPNLRPTERHSRTLSVGVVGLSFGRHIVEVLSRAPAARLFHLAGICDLDANLLAETGAESRCRTFDSLDSLLRDGNVEVVGLFTGPAGRAELIRKIIRAGKDVITTKPFELDAAEAESVLSEAEKLGRKVLLNSPGPTVSADLRRIDLWRETWDLGRPIAARGDTWTNYREVDQQSWYDDPARCPIPPIFRLGIYLINDLVHLFGKAERVTTLQSRIFTGRPTADNAQLGIQFESGAIASVFGSFCVADGDDYRNSLTINFERGTIYRNVGPQSNGHASQLAVVVLQNGRRECVDHVDLDDTSGDYQWENFHRCLVGESISHATPAQEIIEGVRIVELMSQASQPNPTAQ